jgi:FkbM family methyltransferase
MTQFFLKLPTRVLVLIEDKVQFSMGKGYGAATTEEESEVIAHFAKYKNIQNVVALDVGASIGNWTASINSAIPNAQIVAFEPSREAFASLEKRFHNNPDVRCFNLALGKSDKKALLFSNASASGLGSLTKRRLDHLEIEFDSYEEVTVSRLDTWMKSQPRDFVPNVLKMDVEGHEFDVLLGGGGGTLREIQIIQFEFGGCNIDTKTFFQDFWYFFKENGFAIYRISPKGPILLDKYREADETFRTTNYVAVRQ